MIISMIDIGDSINMAVCKKRFSKDPKVKLISIKEFLENSNYLMGVTKKDLWKNDTNPEMNKIYYKITSNLLICIIFGYSFSNYGMDVKEKLEEIFVSYRDGKEEYDLFEMKLHEFQEEKEKHKRSKKIDEQIELITKAKKLLPKYSEPTIKSIKPNESYLIDTGYKTTKEELKNKYLVFDVETNGLRKSNDDLLSLSIYDPTTGICYNRYFPLDLQPLILTGFIHGITDETLADATHITQEEMNWLNDLFHLKDRVLLSYSGGQGTFDSSFVQNYCKRHNVIGFDNLQFDNIKSKIPSAPLGTEGQLTKDNLCRMFGIEGVTDIHSSYNDCILEWKLFEKLETECVFFIGEHLFRYTPDYIIPFSYLFKHPSLAKAANVKIPTVQGKATEVYRLNFPKKLMKEIKKFPTNITGITIEHGINVYLKAEEQNNFAFLAENKSHLKYVGSLDSKIKEIPIIAEDDGTVKAIKQEDKEFINEVNYVTKLIIEHIKPIADYLKDNIFKNGKIMTQELTISDDRKVLALCDLSDEENVVEIKTKRVLDENGIVTESLARQLYFQSKGRNLYVLSIKFDTHMNERTYNLVIDDLTVVLYRIELSECEPKKKIYERILDDDEIKALNEIINNPNITKGELAEKLGRTTRSVNTPLSYLEEFGYIKKEDEKGRNSKWVVLRDADDIKTNYTYENYEVHIIKDDN